MDKVVVRKHDRNRVLLTEVLPYETPIFFSNYGFYKVVSKQKKFQVNCGL